MGSSWNPANHPRDPRNGQFVDKLKLAGKINLPGGTKLVGSRQIGNTMLAHLETPDGQTVTRFGVIPEEGHRLWRGADKGATVELDPAARAKLRDTLRETLAAGKRHHTQAKADMAEYDRLYERPNPTSQEQTRMRELETRLPPEDIFIRGNVATDWGDVVLEGRGIDDDKGGWTVDMYIRHRDSVVVGDVGKFVGGPMDGDWVDDISDQLDAAEIRKLADALDLPGGWAQQLSSQMGR